MDWIELRSRRDPAVWLPPLLVTVVLGVFAVWAFGELDTWRDGLRESAARDPDLAAARAVDAIRACEVALLAVSLAFGAFLRRFFALGLREARLPPSGWWSFGAWRARVGPAAQRVCRQGLWLAWLLPGSAVLLIVVLELLLRSLAAGSADTG